MIPKSYNTSIIADKFVLGWRFFLLKKVNKKIQKVYLYNLVYIFLKIGLKSTFSIHFWRSIAQDDRLKKRKTYFFNAYFLRTFRTLKCTKRQPCVHGTIVKKLFSQFSFLCSLFSPIVNNMFIYHFCSIWASLRKSVVIPINLYTNPISFSFLSSVEKWIQKC